MLKSVCVFCGSRTGDRDSFRQSAEALGQALARADKKLVYGGGQVGLMGILAKAALAENGHVIGIIPEFLNQREVKFDGVTELIVTTTLRDRLSEMARLSDGFVVLPGGIGTLDELMQMFTQNLLRQQDKPIYLLNLEGFWNPFLAMLDAFETDGFMYPESRKYFQIIDTVDALMAEIV
jgi:uncharacterized protein (TIGR00730 family)